MLCKMNNTSILPQFCWGKWTLCNHQKKHMFWNQFTYHLLAPSYTWIFSYCPAVCYTFNVSDGPVLRNGSHAFGGKSPRSLGRRFDPQGAGEQRGSNPSKRCPVPGVIPKVSFFWGWLQGSLYSQPKQCTIKGEILQIYHTCVVFHFPQMGNLMIPG